MGLAGKPAPSGGVVLQARLRAFETHKFETNLKLIIDHAPAE
jgi:hypothetical protein